MRILYVTAHYPPDFVSGATMQVQRLATGAARAGHDVHVMSGAIRGGLADGETRDERIDGVEVRWLGTSERIMQDDDANWRNPAATAVATEIVVRWQPDVLHAHALQTLGAELLGSAADQGVATFVTMHDLWWWCPRLFLVDRDLRPCPIDTRVSDCACARDASWRMQRAAELATQLTGVDRILVPSEALRQIVVANGVAASRVTVDENDVDVVPAGDHEAAAPGPTGTVRFLYVGGDSPLKGCDVVLAAARAMRRRRAWILTVHGVTPPRRGRRQLRRVSFEPPYPPERTAAVMAGADVLLIPSIARESFSLAAREALAAGLAVITSDCLGPEEVVEHDRNGLVVPTGDANALAGAMRALVEDPERLARLRRAAGAEPPSLRQVDEHVTMLLDAYRSALRDRP